MDDEVKDEQEESKLQTSTKQELDKYLNRGSQDNDVTPPSVNQQTKTDTIGGSPDIPDLYPGQTLKNLQKEVPQTKSVIRTYKSDMEETIRSQHLSSLNIAIAENDKMVRRMTDDGVEEEKKADKNYKIFILIIILIVAGISVFAVPYFLVKKQTTPTETEETISNSSLIVFDTAERVNIDELNKDRIAKTLGERVDQISITLGSIRQFYITEGEGDSVQVITAKKFLELIKARVPDGISRTTKDPFMFGMHSFNGNQKFLILKVGSYETTYAGMLVWENALWYDFSELFGLKAANEIDSSGRPILGEDVRKFQDVVIKNKDVRAIKDAEGKITFLYSVVDKNTVVFTTSQDTFKEILNRMDKMSVTR